jgi:hypothetical protein
VVHALELAVEDVRRWCGDLRDAEWNARPWGLPSPGFQLRHMARSLDRLLTYAEAGALSEEQVEALGREGTEAELAWRAWRSLRMRSRGRRYG